MENRHVREPKPIVARAEPDEVTQAALDSFPASDPPSWPGLRLGPPAESGEETGRRAGVGDEESE